MRQGSKGEGNTASKRALGRASGESTVWDADAPPEVGMVPTRAAVRSTASSWRPSAGLSPIERYGRFEILGRVGRGGMAEILLARERSVAGSTRHLVLKRVLPEIQGSDEMLHMFLDEARVVMGLFHPNLCQIFEVGELEGSWFIAMEWVNGVTLQQLIRRAMSEGNVNYAVLARVISLCAEALHHAHTARDGDGRPLHLVHRDVSPHNIMVGYDGRVKLLDFGIAKSTKSTHQTEAGVVKGKVCYMSPEQWMCGPLDARTDVFALGACLYEALTGKVVFKRDSQAEVMRAVLEEGAPPLREVAPEVPAQLAAIAHRALAFDASERFQSALEMSEALEDYQASLSSSLPSSKLSGYVRQLFSSEVELGPLLERCVRGAHLPASAVFLPPLPKALVGLPKLTAGMLGSPESDLEGEPGQLPYPALPRGSRSSLAGSGAGFDIDDASTRTVAMRSALDRHGMEDVTQSAERPLSVPSSDDSPGPSLLVANPAKDPLSPQRSPEARPAARTVSMHGGLRRRRIALAALPVCAALLLGFAVFQRSRDATAVAPAVASQAAPPSLSPAAQPPLLVPPSTLLQKPVAPAPLDTANAQGEPEALEVAAPRETKKGGRLSINTRPWSTVYLGTRVLGTTPLADVAVPRGALKLKLVDRDGRVHLRRIAASQKRERSAFYDFDASSKPRARRK